MAAKKTKSAVPKGPFIFLRLLQLAFAAICLGVLGYFQYALYADNYKIPYEFALLDFTVRPLLPAWPAVLTPPRRRPPRSPRCS